MINTSSNGDFTNGNAHGANGSASIDSRLSAALSPSYDQLNMLGGNRGRPTASLAIAGHTAAHSTSLSDGDYGSREASPVPSNASSRGGTDGMVPKPAGPPKQPAVISVTGLKPMGVGSMHLSVQYFSVRKRLRVNVMKAEGE